MVSTEPRLVAWTLDTYADVATVGPRLAGPKNTMFCDVFVTENPDPLITTIVPPATLPLAVDRLPSTSGNEYEAPVELIVPAEV